MFNKNKPKITFTFENVEGGVTMKVKVKGSINNTHIFALKSLIDEKVKGVKNNVKNGRK